MDTFGESDIFMSRCQKCQNVKTLKNRVKSERSNIFKNGHMRKVAQKFTKNQIFFYYPWFLQCMEIIWVNFSKSKGIGTEFNLINALSRASNIILSINEVKFGSNTLIFGKVYPDYFHAL